MLSSFLNLPYLEPLRSEISCRSLSFMSHGSLIKLALRGLVAYLFHIVQITVCKSN
jgi:hypothetical protein